MPTLRALHALLACLALSLAGPAAARTLIVNVNGITLDAQGEVQRFAMLLVGNDGRVETVLPRGAREPKLAAGDFRLDGKGATLLPGLIDAHGHVLALGLTLRSLDLAGTPTLAAALEKARSFAATQPGSAWVTGRGWNQEAWGSGFPTAADLDSAIPDRPAYLVRVDGHAAWLNSAALKAAGIDAKTRDPDGGRILRGPGGAPSGILVDKAMALAEAVIPPPSALEQDKALQAAFTHLLGLGITGVHDMGVDSATWNLYRSYGDSGRLALRITAYAAGMESMDLIAPLGPTAWLYDERLRLQGVKLYADGALGSRGALLKAPYADEPGTSGLALVDTTRLRNMMSRANFVGYQLAVHAIGDAANTQVLDAYAEIRPAYGDSLRNRVEHAQVLDVADIARFANLGVIASVQPIHAVSDARMAEARLGPGRLEGAYAWKSLLTAGARLAFGSDFPVEPANPFLGMEAAVTRSGWRQSEAVTAREALAGFTTWAAYAGRSDGKVGQLVAGAHADFILVDRDPLTIAPEELSDVKVLETWVGGKRLFRAGPAALSR